MYRLSELIQKGIERADDESLVSMYARYTSQAARNDLSPRDTEGRHGIIAEIRRVAAVRGLDLHPEGRE